MRIFIRALEIVVITLMGLITIALIAEVLLRGFAGFSLITTDEFSRYFMIWTAMLAAALLVYEDGHVRTNMLPDALPPFAASILAFVSDVITLCFLAAMVSASLRLMSSFSEQNTVTLGVSMVWFHAALPVAGSIMFFLTLRAMILRLMQQKRPG